MREKGRERWSESGKGENEKQTQREPEERKAREIKME